MRALYARLIGRVGADDWLSNTNINDTLASTARYGEIFEATARPQIEQ